VAPKSNATYLAYNSARRFVNQDKSRPVPEHLRNAPTKLMKEMGFGAEYRYAHDEPEAYAAGENYFPDDMPKIEWYKPTPRGLDQKIAEKLAHLRALDAQRRRGTPNGGGDN
jgi:putative ATPase